MKTYQEILKEVKEKSPAMSHKDAQKAASSIFREAKEAAVEKEKASDKPKAVPSIDIALSKKIEDAIYGPDHFYDKNKIIQVANSFGDFELIEAGKDGVNTLVYLDGPTRVPAAGYFKIFIAR